MLLRKRQQHWLCTLPFRLLLVMLGCILMIVIVLHPPPPTVPQAATVPTSKRSADAGYRMDFADSQEWALEAEDEGEDYSFIDAVPPFISLREDQLLMAVASPRARREQSQSRRGGSYRFIRQANRRQEEEASERDWGTEEEEDGEVAEESHSLDPQDLSQAHSAHRPPRKALPEARHPLCLQQHPEDSLPTASVILWFHNEPRATLLRTVHSVLDTAPEDLLTEIILVDDCSEQEELKSALSDYVAKLEGVKLIRSNKRLGAIGARMLGATRATGDVLVFMNSHCRCHAGWLEPLLSRIAGDRSRVVSPIVDVIDGKTFQYHPAQELQRGVLDWKLDLHWEPLSEPEKKAQPSPISPVRSPVVVGEVVAIDRHYFQNTGAYDPLMALQGGENLELSLKAWLCGGSVEVVPCSRVGHLYPSQDSRTSLDKKAILMNKVRIAEIWLGSFKETFYRHSSEAFRLSKAATLDFRERVKLQRSLGCRTFHWFLANIYPELYPAEPRPKFTGKLRNKEHGFCADCQAEGDPLGCPVVLAPCSDRRQQQLEHIGRKEIHFGSPTHLCFDVRQEQVILQDCTQEGPSIHPQLWDFQKDGMLVHIVSGKCMDALVEQGRMDLFLSPCEGKASQMWRFDRARPVGER
ncbi:polypeptide N-acetylgalactosaminyltransferase 15 isoform X2 [Perognathus longimembris pacificus]|uniref:polypeptide N-acetylgalactosaminyltransferase 15 isoform X2 n=1 Tax=Perognathus longimembris pacificus TaxID=214514 RepID=UPI00201A20E0|nr:polypeptide N-acetylgalactosaminyltransferase 15 isoform X2 [Perognathus longimembris pacificus]